MVVIANILSVGMLGTSPLYILTTCVHRVCVKCVSVSV